jgi:hypothetical protein
VRLFLGHVVVLFVGLVVLVLALLVSMFRRVGGDWESALLEPGAIKSGFSAPVSVCYPSSYGGGSLQCLGMHSVMSGHRNPWLSMGDQSRFSLGVPFGSLEGSCDGGIGSQIKGILEVDRSLLSSEVRILGVFQSSSK